MKRTTASIDFDLLVGVNRICNYEKKKKNRILLHALRRASACYSKKVSYSAVMYQKIKGKRVCVHLSLSSELYEILTDIRSSGKISVSALLAEGLRLLLAERRLNSDSYPVFSYQIIIKKQGNWVIREIKWREAGERLEKPPAS